LEVDKDGKRSRVTMSADGKSVKVTEVKEEKKEDKKDPKPDEKEKEIEIPEKAAKAVKAIKAIYPDAVVKAITHEVFDDGTGEMEIMRYEVEFTSKGVKHEMLASPDGVIPHLWVDVAAKDLPKAVTDALDKEVPGAKVEKAKAFEIRAGLQLAARDKPRFYYTARVEKDKEEKTVKLKPNGDVIKDPMLPKKDK
jgi:hypothetical protein